MKIKLIIFAFALFFFFFPKPAYADGEFDVATNSTYTVAENGNTNVKQTVTITNKTEFTYTPKYFITSAFREIENLSVYNDAGLIPNILKENPDGQLSIEITFKDRVVGEGQVNRFTVEFDTREVATKKGAIWEVNIPGISAPDNFTDYNITLSVPASFGQPKITKPNKELTSRPYKFSKDQIDTAGVFILFGEVQYYKLDLVYHIENSKVVPVKTEIALPPNTSYQRVRINKVVPPPRDVYQDIDGNWLAVYALAPREKLSINAEVFVEVFSDPRLDDLSDSLPLAAAKYWEASDPKILEIANGLKTPRAIYDYVVSTLEYNYEKVGDNNVRVGAREALNKPEYAVCLEFTDLFIALARAAGIPARSVEGYAFTDDSKLRPLSLVQDVLHSWPEYYDEKSKKWVMVDPTWGNTTRGVDYFSSFDFDHIAFTVKGADSTYPIPAGGYKANGETKDVTVTLAEKLDFKNIVHSEIEIDIPDRNFSALPVGGSILIKNLGNLPIMGKTVTVKSDLSPSTAEYKVDTILPHGTAVINLEFEKTPLLTNQSYNVTILFDGASKSKEISVSVLPDNFILITGGIISVGSIIIAWAAYKTWRLYLQKRRR